MLPKQLVSIFCLASISRLVQGGHFGIGDDWQPVLQPELFDGHGVGLKTAGPQLIGDHQQEYQEEVGGGGDQCAVYKVGFTQDLYFQYIRYKTHVPELKEFTLCFWSKFTNHSNDHPIFSYAIDGQPKAISAWISNTDRSSYFSLAVEGHTFFRLNYPIRLNKWYHTCESWNGKTGEWQIWVDAERVGRGFHNRLVGHVIPSGGVAISGQEQTQVGGGFHEGEGSPKGAGGMLGEITMLQLYNVALTAGKAHRDHKHHHAHQYDHNGNQITTPAPTTPQPRALLPTHPLLTAGQINRNVRLNVAGGQPQTPPQPQVVTGQSFNAQFLNGQFIGNLVSQQLQQQQQPQQIPQQGQLQFIQQPLIGSGLVHSSLTNPANVQFIDTTLDTHQLFKRGNEEVEDVARFGDKIEKVKRDEKNQKKRELFISGGTIIDDGFPSSGQVRGGQLDYDGLALIGQNQPIIEQQRQNDEREPAEAEVMAVMNVCTGCDQEPFEKALVLGWRTVPKKLYSGAYYLAAAPQCKAF